MCAQMQREDDTDDTLSTRKGTERNADFRTKSHRDAGLLTMDGTMQPMETAENAILTVLPTPAKPTRRRRLQNVRDAKKEMARVYDAMKHDEMPLDKGKSLVYALGQYVALIRDCEFESRIADLEKRERGK